jgi:hypothetical protein
MSDIIQEIWDDPPENLKLNKYQISTGGKIRSKKNGIILKLYSNGGYLEINLYTDDKTRKNYSIQKLVALTFIPNPENKPTVDHKNRNPEDNNVDNLRWATHAEQIANRCKFKHKERRVLASENGLIIRMWDKVSDILSEYPDILDYLEGRKQHLCYTFYYLDKVILPDEVFRGINIDGSIKYVSNLGRHFDQRCKKFRYGSKNVHGYMKCRFNDKQYLISRLVAFAFVERPLHLINIPYEELVVNHFDGIKTNNIFTNLGWMTQAENVRYTYEHLQCDGVRAVKQYTLQGKYLAKYRNSVEASKAINKFNGDGSIRDCCRKLQNFAYNYLWRYEEDELGELPTNIQLRVPILQYKMNGDFVFEHSTASEASRTTGICLSSIYSCCNLKYQHAGNFIWRRKVT